ncbi:MAG: hypothetical protein JXA99_08665 [Candidatus Lokiarchaeota archaeon]|nr:hypothetical protein [Candidatus Lokiarchaeota archaeon]
MNIYEAGIIIGGIPIIVSNYINPNEDDIDQIQKGALLSCILDFADLFISPIEYFESDRFIFIFYKGDIKTIDMEDSDLYVYLILSKYYKFLKDLKKKYLPVLKILLNEFINRYNGFNFSFAYLFVDFRNDIDKLITYSMQTPRRRKKLLKNYLKLKNKKYTVV